MRLRLAIAAAIILAFCAPVSAQTTSALVVAACNAQSYPAGANRQVTMDTTGKLCDSGGGGASPSTVTANQGTPNAGGAANAWYVQGLVGSTFAPAQVALNAVTATQILATIVAPSGRNVCNLDTAINIFIGPSGVTTATGIQLLPGACWEAAHTSAAIFGISASATPTAAGVQY